MYCLLFCVFFLILILDVIFSIVKSVQDDGHLPFWKPTSVFAYLVCTVLASSFVFAFVLIRYSGL